MISVNHPVGELPFATQFCEEIWKQNTAESLLIRTKAIICERFFVFETQGCVECRKCRSNFQPHPDFPQNQCSTDFSRFKVS